MNQTTLTCALATLLAGNAAAQLPRPADLTDLDRPFNEYLWVTAHNASNYDSLVANQSMDLRAQLERGVRGLMLDIYEKDGTLYTCHADCSFHGRKAPLAADLGTIVRFLEEAPEAVVTLHLEDHVQSARMDAFIQENPRLFRHSFNPDDPRWSNLGGRWPSLRALVAADQRLLITVQNAALAGHHPPSSAWIAHDQVLTAENYWSLGTTVLSHDYRCVPRWDHVPLAETTTPLGLPRLFLMNHFHGVPLGLHSAVDNRLDVIQDRLDAHCLPAARRMPNYLAIDFIEQGDVLEFAETYNNGGVLASSASGAPVCSFSTAFLRSWSLAQPPRMGCENDTIARLTFRGVRKGQRLTLHDAETGAGTDDYTVIDVLQDVPWDAPQVVESLERDQDSAWLQVRYHRVDGLDAKVSRITTEPAR